MEKQPYDWTSFTLREVINAPVEKVYRMWTVPNEVITWFLRSAEYRDEDDNLWPAHQPVKAGLRYAWQWFGYEATENGVVLEANGHNKLRFTFAGDCEVIVNLEVYEGQTIMVLRQQNIPTDDAHKARIHLGCSQGWSYYMINLKSILEGGLDLRQKDPDLIAHLREHPVAELMQ